MSTTKPVLLINGNPVGQVGGEGGSGGHTIIDSSGSSLAQESGLQFADAHVTDDSTNGRTVVENVKEVASADYSSETEDGMYLIPDGEGAVIEPASDDKVEVTADGVKTYTQLLGEIYSDSKYDFSKITTASSFVIGDNLFMPMYKDGSNIGFSRQNIENGVIVEYVVLIGPTSSYYSNVTDISSNIVPNGRKLTLYYGNKKATVDLQTTANRCWMGDGESVESAINSISYKRGSFSGTTNADGELMLTGFEYSSGYRILLVEDCTLPNATYNITHGSNPNYIVFKSTIGQSVASQNVTIVFWYKQV